MPVSAEHYAAMQQYLHDVKKLLVEVSDYISDDLLAEPRRLVEHGEAPLGMTQLAWVISDERIPVPVSVIARIRAYAAADEEFPEALLG
ncbi:hypothetical protein GCM10023190_19650 [Enteractinococcus fodinae]|uniref:Replication fork clamp-binding protein CrfC n=1 Tax=Enteractinococcus fodinae TaxID=684663 RepID=A0ABU2B5L6_9MICC|nr:hypothetical protein [Enteractinococcus fodinae]MDR7348274.1 replication fork clamp-binding protein CrfC [Enteractinococcus fodinae]